MLRVSHLIFAIIGPLLAVLALSTGCAQAQKHAEKVETQREVAAPVKAVASTETKDGTTHYTVVTFIEGRSELSLTEQQKLHRLALAAKKHGKSVGEIRILAWADNDDPMAELETDSPESVIATERASVIRSYLKKEFKPSADIEVHNMARKPSSFNDLLKGDDFEIKPTFENTGSAPLDNGPKSSLAGNKASKAIILVRYHAKDSL